MYKDIYVQRIVCNYVIIDNIHVCVDVGVDAFAYLDLFVLYTDALGGGIFYVCHHGLLDIKKYTECYSSCLLLKYSQSS